MKVEVVDAWPVLILSDSLFSAEVLEVILRCAMTMMMLPAEMMSGS